MSPALLTTLPSNTETLSMHFNEPVGRGTGSVFLHHALDNTLPVHAPVAAGATLNFQAWFRDPAAGMTGFNFSDGLSVTFAP